MALLFPQPGDRGEPDVKSGRAGGAARGEQRRIVRDGVQVLARGSLACPRCSLPIHPAPKLPPREPLSCGYCDHTGPAVEFIDGGPSRTPAAAVALVARLG